MIKLTPELKKKIESQGTTGVQGISGAATTGYVGTVAINQGLLPTIFIDIMDSLATNVY